MTTFNYNLDIPDGPNNPSQDQPKMKTNTNSINQLIGVDHVNFNLANGGYHTVIHSVPFSTLASNPPNNNPPVIPAAIGTIGQLFTAQVNETYPAPIGVVGDEILYYLSGGGRLTQFTRNFTPINATPGATYLPGGIIINWGINTIGNAGATYTFTFAQPFTVLPYSILLTPWLANFVGLNPPPNEVFIKEGSVGLKDFQVVTSQIHNEIFQVSWLAIGN